MFDEKILPEAAKVARGLTMAIVDLHKKKKLRERAELQGLEFRHPLAAKLIPYKLTKADLTTAKTTEADLEATIASYLFNLNILLKSEEPAPEEETP